jgi:hypothetical protein
MLVRPQVPPCWHNGGDGPIRTIEGPAMLRLRLLWALPLGGH